MRFADFAVDLAAVIRASRSVGRHHVALRARQLDALSRSSSIPGLRKTRTATYPTPAQEARPEGEEPLYEQATTEQSATSESRADGAPSTAHEAIHTPHASTVNQPATADSSSIRQGPAGGLFSQLQHKTEATFPVSAPGEVHSPLRPTGVFPGSPRSPLNPAAVKTEENTIQYDDLPPGVDVNVFRTPRGSKILGTLGKGKPQEEKPEAQYPAPWADLASSATGPRGPTAEIRPAAEEKPIIPPPETQEKAAAEADQAPTQPLPTKEEASQPNPLQGRAYTLRESKVPATRLSRLWNYSGLAAGMLGGALTESLSRAVGGGGGGGGSEGSVMLSSANMERLVAKLSRMRGAALKLGQMMSFQDAKMLPAPIREVLQRVQDRADYMPSYQRDKVLVANLGENWRELYGEFEETPIAAASIGQVHRATLKSSGKPVAVKIQFPGVADSINSDLDNLAILLTATKLLPKGLYLDKTIDNARTELGWECDYAREAECLTRFGELMADETDVFLVPSVYGEASGKQVLTMDFMEGTAVTRIASFTQRQKDWIGTQILRLCLREITEFRFMQTDPNWTNFLYNESLGKLELLDFGASREFPAEFVALYVRLLQAASRTDRPLVKRLSEELGYLTGHESKAMLDAHVGSILTLAEPFLESAPDVYDFHDQTITERVKGFIPVMLKERLAPPPEETYSLHRKLSGAFLLCARLGSRVPCKELFRQSLEKSGYVN